MDEQKKPQVDAEATELARRNEITAYARKFNLNPEWALSAGISVDQYRQFVLETINLPASAPVEASKPASEIGLSEKEVRQYSVLRALQAQLTGDWSKAGYERELSQEVARRTGKQAQGVYVPWDIQRRALQSNTSSGNKLVETTVAAESFIDGLYNKMLGPKLGVIYMPGLSSTVAIPVLTTPATVAWVAQAGTASANNPAFAQRTLSPKTCVGYVEVTRELILQSTPGVETLVMNDLAKQIAAAIDAAIFAGDGQSNNPVGVIATTGIGSTSGANFSYLTAVAMQGDVEGNNGDGEKMYYVTTPAVKATLKGRAKEDGYPSYIIEPNNTMAGIEVMASKGVGTGNLVYGDFSQVVVGEFGDLDILVNPYLTAASGVVSIHAFKSVDVAVRQPAAFCKATSFS